LVLRTGQRALRQSGQRRSRPPGLQFGLSPPEDALAFSFLLFYLFKVFAFLRFLFGGPGGVAPWTDENCIYFSEKLIPFLFRLYNYVKFKAIKKTRSKNWINLKI
jgi:hypothetical protein